MIIQGASIEVHPEAAIGTHPLNWLKTAKNRWRKRKIIFFNKGVYLAIVTAMTLP